MSILSVRDISKSYKLRKVVKSLSVDIKSGEVVGLLGPNGAGKTTAFYMIVGLIAADTGSILLDGQDLTALPMHRRAKMGVGYLPQEASIFRKLSVEENILAILENRGDLDRAGREEELEKLLDELHVSHVRTSLGISLSGGSRSHGRWPRTRCLCCSTNRLPASIRYPCSTSSASSGTCAPAISAF